MLPTRQIAVVWVLVAGCALDLEASGAGKACRADGRCADGFVCNAERLCVASGVPKPGAPVLDASGGSSQILDAATDAGQGARTHDAAPEAAVPVDGGCANPTEYFVDEDGDGFGRGGDTRRACVAPDSGWAAVAGDCDDGNVDVFPGQSRYFGGGYTGPEGESYDYDCSGSEDPDPDALGPAPDCPALGVFECDGQGYAATGRSGDGVNPICGSVRKTECAAGLLGCGALPSDSEPARCH
jgi:hypothetical protein